MTKLQLTLTSLVAAIPALGLAAVLVMALVNHADSVMKSGVLMGLVVATLLCAAVMALMPAGIWVFGSRTGVAAPRKAKKSKAKGKELEDLEDQGDAEETEEVGELGGESDELGDEGHPLVEDTTVDEELYVEDETLDGDVLDEEASDEDFLSDLEEEEPEPPKKKKKK